MWLTRFSTLQKSLKRTIFFILLSILTGCSTLGWDWGPQDQDASQYPSDMIRDQNGQEMIDFSNAYSPQAPPRKYVITSQEQAKYEHVNDIISQRKQQIEQGKGVAPSQLSTTPKMSDSPQQTQSSATAPDNSSANQTTGTDGGTGAQ